MVMNHVRVYKAAEKRREKATIETSMGDIHAAGGGFIKQLLSRNASEKRWGMFSTAHAREKVACVNVKPLE